MSLSYTHTHVEFITVHVDDITFKVRCRLEKRSFKGSKTVDMMYVRASNNSHFLVSKNTSGGEKRCCEVQHY